MVTNIFVNLPVKDLNKSMEFFKKLGFTFNKQFTNEKAASLVIGEHMYAMLLTEAFFKTFIKKEIADAVKTTEVITAISVENKSQVDEMVEKAMAAGAVKYKDADDYGFMYSRSFQDLDGHLWEVFYMEPRHVEEK